jgi:hypothetical protein
VFGHFVDGYEAKHVVRRNWILPEEVRNGLPENSSVATNGIPHAGEFAPKGTDDTEAVGCRRLLRSVAE